jgi:predicted secreted protein
MTDAFVWAGTLYMADEDEGDTAKTDGKPIAEMVDAGSDEQMDMVEVTSRDSNNNKEYIPGLYGATIACTANFLKADTDGQTAMRTAFAGRLVKGWRLNFDDGSNEGHGIYGNGYVKSLKTTTSVGDKVTLNFDIQFTGAVVYDPDAA